MEPWEIEARLSIQDTLGRYVRFADTGRSEDFSRLFTEDCRYEVLGQRMCLGRQDVAAFVEGTKAAFSAKNNHRGRIRHHVSSIVIEFAGMNEAKASACFLAVSQSGPDHWGTYRDRLLRSGDQWLFAERRVQLHGWVSDSPVASLNSPPLLKTTPGSAS